MGSCSKSTTILYLCVSPYASLPPTTTTLARFIGEDQEVSTGNAVSSVVLLCAGKLLAGALLA